MFLENSGGTEFVFELKEPAELVWEGEEFVATWEFVL